jgi:signal transduction histidine kinase/CheY-like chemotaxis protein
MRHLLSLALSHDQDVVTARQRAVHITQLLGFDVSEQTRVATAVSEIVRNAFRYARGGRVTFAVDADATPQRMVVRVTDEGPGIANLAEILAGRYHSSTGMGLGIVGAKRLMDGFAIESSRAGTTVVIEKHLSARHQVLNPGRTSEIAEALARRRPEGLIEEIQQQNQALLRALDELQRKQQETARLNRELEDTNRGVVALYAELDEKADHLRRADELKSRFLSNMTHEFRTPVNSIIGLSNLMLEDRQRAGRAPEPEVVYIRQAAENLSELVNDLLDLAKVEAGKTVMRPGPCDVVQMFGALRGMLRPLFLNTSVSLVFDAPDGLEIYTDEGKLSQVLRNLISNALKFTERGEVRVTATPPDPDGFVSCVVTDTGIGIAPEDQERIFEEFTQVEHRLQSTLRGTGLGLPLARRLAELLGGTLTVQSEPGVGSVFTLRIPAHYAGTAPVAAVDWTRDPSRVPLLVVEDAADAQYVYQRVFRTSGYQPYPALSVAEAKQAIDLIAPGAIILDIMLADGESWDFLVSLRRAPATASIPVVVISAGADCGKAMALGADACLAKPLDPTRLLETLESLRGVPSRPLRVLVVDDEEVARYLIRQNLAGPAFEVTESVSGEAGLQQARLDPPDVILLDLNMPGAGGPAVLGELRRDDATRDIPVIIVTSQVPADRERAELLENAYAILSKMEISHGALGAAVRAAAAWGRRDATPRR